MLVHLKTLQIIIWAPARSVFAPKAKWFFKFSILCILAGKRVLLHWKETICHLSITQLQIRWAKTKNPICCVFHAIVILVTSCCQPGQRGWPNQALNFKRLILEAGECVNFCHKICWWGRVAWCFRQMFIWFCAFQWITVLFTTRWILGWHLLTFA